MPVEFLYIYLVLLLMFLAIAFPIAVAVDRGGSRGVRVTVFTTWIVLTLVQPVFWPLGLQFPLEFWILSPFVAAITLAVIFIPMKSLSRCSWDRGRMAAGLVGAAVMALVYPFLVLFVLSALDFTF
jgi:hypothetical protein